MDETTTLQAAQFIAPLINHPFWIPYFLRESKRPGKLDKIPSLGLGPVSYTKPENLHDMGTALHISLTKELNGIGVAMGVQGQPVDGLRLIGFDFDTVDEHIDEVLAYLGTYAETSPSGTGVRAFAFAPEEWAKSYRDTVDAHPPGCEHAEIYLGTSARFLTVTLDMRLEARTAILDEERLTWLATFLRPAEDEPMKYDTPVSVGTPHELRRYSLAPAQQRMVCGNLTGITDRSRVLNGLIIRLIDQGLSREDLLASLEQNEHVWAIAMDKRHNREDRAHQFLVDEINRAWPRSIRRHGNPEDLPNIADVVALSPLNFADVVTLSPLNFADNGPDPDEPTPEQAPLLPRCFQVPELLEPPGLVGEMAALFNAQAPYNHPLWGIGAALVTLSAVSGNSYVAGPLRTALNLYVLLLGPSASGKDWYRMSPLRVLSELGISQIATDLPASGAALLQRLHHNPNCLMLVDEVAHVFAALEGRGNYHGAALEREILSLFSAATSAHVGKAYSDQKKNIEPINGPFLQLLGAAVPMRFWETMRSSNAISGLLGRFLVIPHDRGIWSGSRRAAPVELPADLIARLRVLQSVTWKSQILVNGIPEGANIVRLNRMLFKELVFTPEALALYEARHDEFRARFMQGDEDSVRGVVWGRALELSIKIGALLALGCGREQVEASDLAYGIAFATASCENMVDALLRYSSDSDFEAQLKKVMRLIDLGGYRDTDTKTPPGRIMRKDLLRASKMKAFDLDQVLGHLLDTGDVLADEIDDAFVYYRMNQKGVE